MYILYNIFLKKSKEEVAKLKNLVYNININKYEKGNEKMTNGEYLKKMFQNNLFAIVYPKDKTEESAEKLAALIDSAAGVAKIESDGKYVWGVLIDKTKIITSREKEAQDDSDV